MQHHDVPGAVLGELSVDSHEAENVGLPALALAHVGYVQRQMVHATECRLRRRRVTVVAGVLFFERRTDDRCAVLGADAHDHLDVDVELAGRRDAELGRRCPDRLDEPQEAVVVMDE